MTALRALHLLPRQGRPKRGVEVVSQRVVKIVSYLPVYTAIMITLTFCAIIFGVPFVEGK